MYATVLVATDGSDCAAAAATHAIDLAARYDAALHALFVVDQRFPAASEFDQVVERLEATGEAALESIEDEAAGRGVEVDLALRRGTPYEEILGYVEHNGVDVVFVGTKGRNPIERFVHAGSTTERVIRRTRVPVVAVPLPAAEREGGDDATS